VGYDQLSDIPGVVPVTRAFALDTARHLGIKGRYLDWMAVPDRWISWFLGAVPTGMALIHKYKPKVLWSTYPIATAHLIGLTLHRLTGILWIADFRDPMTEEDPITHQKYPTDPRIRRSRQWIERLAVEHSSRSVFVTPGALRIYADRYPQMPASHWELIANGYDEESFLVAEQIAREKPYRQDRIILLHSGVLYPTPDRDPSAFFSALANLQSSGLISPSNLHIVLRASGYESHYQGLIRSYGLEDIVSLEPSLPYRHALAEMLNADGLLIFQGYTSNPAIPAKLYEYLRARRPVFAMVDPAGDTARELRQAGVGKIVSLDSQNEIADGLLEFLRQIREGNAPIANTSVIQGYARESCARKLAALLDTLDG
jgi:glycosyltransferase involved in cell wall biosynthesis